MILYEKKPLAPPSRMLANKARIVLVFLVFRSLVNIVNTFLLMQKICFFVHLRFRNSVGEVDAL